MCSRWLQTGKVFFRYVQGIPGESVNASIVITYVILGNRRVLGFNHINILFLGFIRGLIY